MKLKIKATLKGKVEGSTAVWPDGSTFDDEIEPIPDDIIAELESGSGLVEDITPVNVEVKVGGVKDNTPPTNPISVEEPKQTTFVKKEEKVIESKPEQKQDIKIEPKKEEKPKRTKAKPKRAKAKPRVKKDTKIKATKKKQAEETKKKASSRKKL